MAVDLLLLLREGRRREPRRLAAEMPVALLLLEEGRRHEPRELAAPLVLLPLLRGSDDTNPANSLRRCAACSAAAGRGTTTPRPGGALLHGEVRRHLAGVCRHAKSDAARQAARVDDAHPSTHRPVRLFPPSRRGCAS